ncbi:MAG TPA: ABC transporter substrate-binding protein [Desulfobacterales bacterium]|nr:ABC transporter substrate-binding protein [Desulfobacterales bacterium]
MDITKPKIICLLAAFFMVILPWTECRAAAEVHIRYSRNFKVKYKDGVTLITVSNPWRDAGVGFRYLLKRRGTPTPAGYKGYQVVEVPVRRMVLLSPTYLAFIEQLGLVDKLKGFSNLSRVYSKTIRQAAREGKIKNVGQGSNLRVEDILDLKPDIIFTYATGGFRDAHPKLLEAGLKVGVCAEYMESHPLGRAEWIKFFALFFNKGAEAERLFNALESRYLRLAALTRKVKKRPTVITNTPFSGHWYVAGGNSFVARFIQDAGGDYIWRDIHRSGSIPMDIELVYNRGLQAEFWLNTGVWTSLAQARNTAPRLVDFASLRAGRLFNNNRRLNAAGGNDFWESGIMRPDVILADIIRILHPKLLPHHQLYYYRQLK